ncbi:ester cyclase [Caballeronia sp. LjRoot34]
MVISRQWKNLNSLRPIFVAFSGASGSEFVEEGTWTLVRTRCTSFREALPDLNFWGAADLIAEGEYVVGRWKGGGTHAGPASAQ